MKMKMLVILILLISRNNFSQWIQTNSPQIARSYSIVVSGSNIYTATDTSGVFLSTDRGKTWHDINNGLTITHLKSLAVCKSNLLAGTGYGGPTSPGGIFLSTNNGNDWIKTTPDSLSYTIYNFAVRDSFVLACSWWDLVLYSSDSGVSWAPIPVQPLPPNLTNTVVRSVAIGDSAIYAGIDPGGVFRSIDKGMSWTRVLNGLISVFSLLVSNDTIYAGTYGDGVFISTNNGDSWNSLNSRLTNKNVRCLLLTEGNLFAGTTKGGVFLLNRNSSNWIQVDSGYISADVTSITCSDNEIFVSTYGEGIWHHSLSQMYLMTGISTVNHLDNYGLSQNYPNPFNPTTTIKYQIQKTGLVQLKVFDILGREVATLVNEVQSVGEHSVLFNGQQTTNYKQLSSGVYFYQLKAGDYISTKKMIILK